MRHPRIKPQEDTFVHVYNRTAGSSAERPFGPAEKTEFIRRLKRLSRLYVIEPLAFQAMLFVTRLDARVRYWVDGLVIGSELFVRNTVAKYRTAVNGKKRRLVRALRPDRQPEPALWCFKQLRVLVE